MKPKKKKIEIYVLFLYLASCENIFFYFNSFAKMRGLERAVIIYIVNYLQWPYCSSPA